jgi:superfamily I DNA/RNA helicase/mRNA-degrading endonuclease RelE of RelBE toxin-antitoxin system
MKFLIADTFTSSLARLMADEQKAVKTTVFDLQTNIEHPSLKFHKLEKAKDRNFWSVRVSGDLRIIIHKSADSLLLCYVDHHDRAYDWGERRKLETHPKTGAAQIVEVRETVKEIVVKKYIKEEHKIAKRPVLSHVSEEELLGYGVPPEWAKDVQEADEDALMALAERFPSEAAEAVLELATGGRPQPREAVTAGTDPFAHPDAQRRFRLMTDQEELAQALDFPWEKWAVFLHPDQRDLVERDFTGPARVLGSAGTGKTIVALHRAVHLARKNPDARVLLTTFFDTLADSLKEKLRCLIGREPRLLERIDVESLDSLGLRLHKVHCGTVSLVDAASLSRYITESAKEVEGQRFSQRFLEMEWEQVVDAWQLKSWDEYRDVARLGRRVRLNEAQRKILWEIFSKVWDRLSAGKSKTLAGVFHSLVDVFGQHGNSPYDFAVIDEAQDIGISQLRFFAALLGSTENGLFFTGDLGQRIFQQPFSWKSLGVEVRGRSRTLRINYRTSHQIRMQADRLLAPESRDVDENVQKRGETISVFSGPPPWLERHQDNTAETESIAAWIKERLADGINPEEVAIFVRSPVELGRAKEAIAKAGAKLNLLDEKMRPSSGCISVSTMHLAKGLEFRAVVVMACDHEVLPLQERISAVGDPGDLEEVYDSERQLLYVACTRARDCLLVSGVEPISVFLDDLKTD